jgi:cyanoexosortase A
MPPFPQRLLETLPWALQGHWRTQLAHQLRRHAGNRRSLWLLLALLLFSWSALQLHWADVDPKFQLLNLLIWFGCTIALEDQLPLLWPRPSRVSLLLGGGMIGFALWRGSWLLNQQDRFLYLLVPLLVWGLALLNRPFSRLRCFVVPGVIALLFPVGYRLSSLHPYLERPTAQLSWLLLTALGFEPVLSGREVMLSTGGVAITGTCTGIDQIVVSLVVVLIFLMVFPLRRWRHRLAALLIALVSAVVVNAVRIALLALLVAVPEDWGSQAFDFFHDSYGSLVFSLIAVFVLGWGYTKLIDVELSNRQLSSPSSSRELA